MIGITMHAVMVQCVILYLCEVMAENYYNMIALSCEKFTVGLANTIILPSCNQRGQLLRGKG